MKEARALVASDVLSVDDLPDDEYIAVYKNQMKSKSYARISISAAEFARFPELSPGITTISASQPAKSPS